MVLYVISFITLLFLPESPVFLIRDGQYEQAKVVIYYITKWNGSKTVEETEDFLKSME